MSAAVDTNASYLTATRGWKSWAYTLDHKRIGMMYLFGILGALLLGGAFALLVRAELCASKGEARRLITQGGVYVNNQRESAPDKKLDLSSMGTESYVFLRSGKKNYRLLHVS